ncbi:class V chitinase CHIT5a-like [Rutidosis leptorrhynchoides]|uniref:class V chitinase CHIT5a-like n=1 Tax=Rutidosis leptorrhynchoides TaxID=125765 RepID=UPI003A98F39C
MATQRITFLFFLTILNFPSSIFTLGSQSYDSVSDQGVRAAYWPSFTGYPSSSINTSYFSHIYYAFVLPSATNYTLDITSDDVDNLLEFENAKSSWNPPVKTVLSIGGGGGGDLPNIFSEMASQEYSRATFINSTIKVAREYNFDGVDLDWEYPSNNSDMANLGLLLYEWRLALEQEANVTNRARLILTSAVYYASDILYDSGPRSYPSQVISQYVDWISPMCFDYHGTWNNFTGLNSALYDPNTDLSTDFGIGSWIHAGVPTKKIVLGLPLYGPTWSLKDPNVNTIGAPTTSAGPGSGKLVYSEIVDFNKKNNATVVLDNTRVSYYSYAGESWMSFDDIESIRSKVHYAQDRALGGYFFWAIGQDLEWAISSTASEAWLTKKSVDNNSGNTFATTFSILVSFFLCVYFVLIL